MAKALHHVADRVLIGREGLGVESLWEKIQGRLKKVFHAVDGSLFDRSHLFLPLDGHTKVESVSNVCGLQRALFFQLGHLTGNNGNANDDEKMTTETLKRGRM